MANFVPEGEDNSASKQTLGRRRPNFVPAEGQEEAAPSPGPEAAWLEARAARHASRGRAKKLEWEKAVDHLQRMTPSSAVSSLQHMPEAIRSMHLLVEEATLNRSAVLRFFPPVGPTAREVWKDFAESSKTKSASTTGKKRTT